MGAWMHGRVLVATLLTLIGVLGTACVFGSDDDGDAATPTPVRTTTTGTTGAGASPPASTPVLSPTTPAPPTVISGTYVVEAGDSAALIAQKMGVPLEEQAAWAEELLALNGAEAETLQIGQELVLPPVGAGGGDGGATAQAPEAAATDTPVVVAAEPTATEVPPEPTLTETASPSPTITETPTPTVTSTPTVTPTPAATRVPTAVPTNTLSPSAGCASFANQAVRDWCNHPTGDVLNCEHFISSSEATRFLRDYDSSNINGLDGDVRDNVACEGLG